MDDDDAKDDEEGDRGVKPSIAAIPNAKGNSKEEGRIANMG